MKHQNGDHVTSAINIPPAVQQGDTGTVTAVHPTFGSYGVTFNGLPEMVMEANEIKETQ